MFRQLFIFSTVNISRFKIIKLPLKVQNPCLTNGIERNEIFSPSRQTSSQSHPPVNSVTEETSLPPQTQELTSLKQTDGLETVKAEKPSPSTDHGLADLISRPAARSKLKGFKSLIEYRHIYPEFLPDPDPSRRHRTRETLERLDMLNRRRVLDIPEFYVGSILAVTAADEFAPGKSNRFVGICILRAERGTRTNFTLRNVVDHQGVEIMYELYNPCILKIEVLRLEKRLDEQLLYLRDADLKHSTFPFDMEAEHHPENTPVPLNDIKIALRPRPWFARWELWHLNGVLPFELEEKFWKLKEKTDRPWTSWDLMMDYRKRIPEEDQLPIWQEVEKHHKEMKRLRKTDRKKILLKQALEKK